MPLPTPECSIHKDRPDECPRNHICERCGLALNEHHSAGMNCPDGRSFSADEATRQRFPNQYADA